MRSIQRPSTGCLRAPGVSATGPVCAASTARSPAAVAAPVVARGTVPVAAVGARSAGFGFAAAPVFAALRAAVLRAVADAAFFDVLRVAMAAWCRRPPSSPDESDRIAGRSPAANAGDTLFRRARIAVRCRGVSNAWIVTGDHRWIATRTY